MAVKIRLARKGRKKLAFYHIVVADSRSPRDGRYIEKIGSYNPVTNPATIELDFEKTLGWLQNGAIPTDTCRAILSYKGVLIKKHLLEGVKKGAFDEAEATKRFDTWVKQNEEKIEAKKSSIEKSQEDELGQRLTVEKRISEVRAAKLAKRNADLAAKEAAGEKAEAQVGEEVSTEEPAQPPVAEEIASEPAAEEAVSEPVAEETSSEQLNEETISGPVAESASSDQVAEDKPKE